VVRAFGVAGLIMGSLLTLIFVVQGETDAIGPIWLLTLACCGGLLVLSLLVMLLVFRDRMRFRFSVSDDRILVETIDATARPANRLAVLAGVLAGKPGAAGTGLIATSQESQSASFDGAFRAEYRPRSRAIVLRNRWRMLLVVYCTAENYDRVAARIAAGIEAHGTAGRLPARSPIPRFLAYTALVVIACIPAFLTVEAFDVPLLIPLITVCFALAMLWLVGLFGWVVLGCIAFEIGAVVVNALSLNESFLRPGETYARWTVYSGDDWALLALTAAGLAVLAWLSVRALRGRLRSTLDSDYADMGG
jgi:hypothetical protein